MKTAPETTNIGLPGNSKDQNFNHISVLDSNGVSGKENAEKLLPVIILKTVDEPENWDINWFNNYE